MSQRGSGMLPTEPPTATALSEGWEAGKDPQSGRTYNQKEPPCADPQQEMTPLTIHPVAAGSSASLEDVRANNHHLRWHKAQLAFGILFLALWLCAVIALCVRWARTEERASKICRDKPKFQFRGYQDDYAHCDAGFVCVHGSIDSGGNVFAGIGSGGNLPFCESSDSKLCSDPEAAAACSNEQPFSSGIKSDKCFEKADVFDSGLCAYGDEACCGMQQAYSDYCKMKLGIPCPGDGKYFCRDPSALAACSDKGSESGSCYKQFGLDGERLDVCKKQEADKLYSWTGTALAVCAIGLFFPACAVGSSILYNTCNCYKPPTKSTLLTIARLSEIATYGEKWSGILHGNIERMPTNFVCVFWHAS